MVNIGLSGMRVDWGWRWGGAWLQAKNHNDDHMGVSSAIGNPKNGWLITIND